MLRPRDLTLLVGRLVLGGYLAAHGAQKLFGAFGGPGLGPVAQGFDRIGLRPGTVTAAAAGMSELGGGLLTAAGALDPLGPLAVAGTMAVASTTHRANGPFMQKGGYHQAATNLAAALVLVGTGAGSLSLDRALGVQVPRWAVRLAFAAGLGAAIASIAMLLRAARAPVTEPAGPAADDGSAADDGAGTTEAEDRSHAE